MPATRGDRAWYYPDQAAEDDDTPIAALVYLVDPGPPETVSVRLLNFIPDDDSAIGPAPDGGFTFDAGPFETSPTPAAGKVVIDADATGAEFDALEARMDVVEAQNASDDARLDAAEPEIDALQAADVSLDARLDALEAGTSLPAPIYGFIVMTGGGGLSLSGSPTILTGGSLAHGSGITYNAGTGEATIASTGVYAMRASATIARLVGLTAPDITLTIFVNGVATAAVSSTTLGILADTRTIDCEIVRSLNASDVVTVRLTSSLSLSIQTSRFSLALHMVRT